MISTAKLAGQSSGGYGGTTGSGGDSGGQSKAAFGSVNFGAGAKVGGTSTTDGDAGTGLNSTVLLYAGLGLGALLVVYLLLKR